MWAPWVRLSVVSHPQGTLGNTQERLEFSQGVGVRDAECPAMRRSVQQGWPTAVAFLPEVLNAGNLPSPKQTIALNPAQIKDCPCWTLESFLSQGQWGHTDLSVLQEFPVVLQLTSPSQGWTFRPAFLRIIPMPRLWNVLLSLGVFLLTEKLQRNLTKGAQIFLRRLKLRRKETF